MNNKFTPDEIEMMREWLASGLYDLADIAESFGCAVRDIADLLSDDG